MKVAGKKIPKGNVLLFFSFTAVSLCLLLVLSAGRADRQNNLSRNNLYTGHNRSFSISYAESEEGWEAAIVDVSAKHNNFAIYVPLKDSDSEVRGIYLQGEMDTPPMLEGKYFDRDSSWTDTPSVVLGKEYAQEAKKRDGKMFYDYGDTEFEVIGIMGTEDESRINYMVLIDFKSGIRLAGINTDYVLDSAKAADVSAIGRTLNSNFASPANFLMLLDDAEGVDSTFSVARLFSGDMMMKTMYVLLLISFFLSTVLASSIWYRFRRQLRITWSLCGYQGRDRLLEMAKRFYFVAFAGFAAGILLMAVVPLFVEGIQMNTADIVQAFGMTMGIGTVVFVLPVLLQAVVQGER